MRPSDFIRTKLFGDPTDGIKVGEYYFKKGDIFHVSGGPRYLTLDDFGLKHSKYVGESGLCKFISFNPIARTILAFNSDGCYCVLPIDDQGPMPGLPSYIQDKYIISRDTNQKKADVEHKVSTLVRRRRGDNRPKSNRKPRSNRNRSGVS